MSSRAQAWQNDLSQAWKQRRLEDRPSDELALRIFFGPAEGSVLTRRFSIEWFADGVWIFERTDERDDGSITEEVTQDLRAIREFLEPHGASFGVFLPRPKGRAPSEAQVAWGFPPTEGRVVSELGRLRFQIRFLETRHPGLFLDHAPLRAWLLQSSRGLKVLNTFAYTGSLSIAAGVGGASKVTTLDLSRPTLHWAEANWKLNGLDPSTHEVLHGDSFEWFPRLAKKSRIFDLVILDPPSFSRGKKGTFSTARDLGPLHAAAIPLVAPGGRLITSINSANVSREDYKKAIESAARSLGRALDFESELTSPDSFPKREGDPVTDYLKGWRIRLK